MTAASAALAEAGIDCIDLVTGGVAALVGSEKDRDVVHGHRDEGMLENSSHVVLDPSASEARTVSAACVVGYLASRDELASVWLKGDGLMLEKLLDGAVDAAVATRNVLANALKTFLEADDRHFSSDGNQETSHGKREPTGTRDVDMSD